MFNIFRDGKLDDLMVFHQSLVTKEPIHVVASLELCSYVCYSSSQ